MAWHLEATALQDAREFVADAALVFSASRAQELLGTVLTVERSPSARIVAQALAR